MATATSDIRVFPPEGPAAARDGLSRHFFFALMLSYAVVAVAGFVPNQIEFVRGNLPLSWAAHVHGALMAAWLLLLVTQSSLPAAGRVGAHRRLGTGIAAFAVLIWLSMIWVAFRNLAVANPSPGHILYDILLLQTTIILLFPLFFGAALLERGRPGWHKRLMVLTALLPLLASIDRMPWLPGAGNPELQWLRFLYLDLLILPLIVWDVRTLGRIHRATALGTLLILASQLVTWMLWMNPAWHQFAHDLTIGLR